MTDNLFDKFIKNKLKDHSSAVPADMWERIQPQNDAERRGAFWWKTVGLVLLVALGVGAGFLVWDKNSTGKTEVVKEELPDTRLAVENGTRNSNNGSAVLPGVKDEVEAVDGVDAARKDKAAGATPSKPSVSTSDNNLGDDNNNDFTAHKKAASFTSNSPKRKQFAEHAATKENLIDNELEPASALNSDKDFSLEDFNKNYQSLLSTTVKTENNLLLSSGKELLSTLSKYNLSCFVNCPSARGPQRNDWYLEIFASPDYAKKTIVKGTGVSDDYLKRKDSSEKLQSAFTAGFRVSKTMGENMLLKGGLQYSQINEKFTYRTENERKLTTVVTIRTIIRAPGDTVIVRDTSSVEQIGYRIRTTSNRYRSIDVPVILSYEFGGEKWKASMNAGVILNLYSWQKGEMLDTSFTPVSFNKIGTGQTFKQNIGVGFYAGFSVLKNVGNNMEIFAEPYFRYNITNMTKDKNPFTQKFNVGGLNLGIRYKLFSAGQHYPGR